MAKPATTADAIFGSLVSPNESDRNLEPANVVDGLFAIARAIDRLAGAITDAHDLPVTDEPATEEDDEDEPTPSEHFYTAAEGWTKAGIEEQERRRLADIQRQPGDPAAENSALPPVVNCDNHGFQPVPGNRYCGQCGAAYGHPIHTEEPAPESLSYRERFELYTDPVPTPNGAPHPAHKFSRVDGNRFCGRCGGGRLHEIHTPPFMEFSGWPHFAEPLRMNPQYCRCGVLVSHEIHTLKPTGRMWYCEACKKSGNSESYADSIEQHRQQSPDCKAANWVDKDA